MMWIRLTAALALVLGICLAHGPAEAQRRLGTFSAWSAYTAEENGKPVCYVASSPQKSEGNYTRRGKVFALVTLRPAEQRDDEVSFIAGYTFQKDSAVKAVIDGKSWTLFTQNGAAWLPNEPAQDKEVVQAMVKGREMVVTGISSRGNQTIDQYSLSGFTAAYKAMREACGKSG
jgi:hypothetical protein